jgi:hypothetical protein
MDPWHWFTVARGQRISYAILLLCFMEVRELGIAAPF